jgi:hypothetical protein
VRDKQSLFFGQMKSKSSSSFRAERQNIDRSANSAADDRVS